MADLPFIGIDRFFMSEPHLFQKNLILQLSKYSLYNMNKR